MPTLSVVELRTFTLDILEKLGTPADFARVVCDNLVGANLVGHDSHGVLRLTTYTQFVRQGAVVPAAAPVVVRRDGATAHVDGCWGWGAVGARLGAQTALALAAEYGVGAVTVNRCMHIGRIGEYVALLAEAGMVGIALCNSGPGSRPSAVANASLAPIPLRLRRPAGGSSRPSWLTLPRQESPKASCAWHAPRGKRRSRTDRGPRGHPSNCRTTTTTAAPCCLSAATRGTAWASWWRCWGDSFPARVSLCCRDSAAPTARC